jgi:hypothetical protein
MTPAQEQRLRQLCTNYNVEFDPSDYIEYPPDSFMMPGWVEGWVGGVERTIYVGVSPEGDSHS